MFYADCSELVAELIMREHACGPGCLCWKLRRVPPIEEALVRIGVPKFQTIAEAIERIYTDKSITGTPTSSRQIVLRAGSVLFRPMKKIQH